MNEIQTKLLKLYACEDALQWAGDYDTFLAAWRACDRGDWVLWLAAKLKVERPLLVKAACQCARLALPYTQDDRPLKAIETAERWASGDPGVSIHALQVAALPALAAFYATEAAFYAARAARAATDRAAHAASEDRAAHAAAAYAARAAASAAHAADDARAARASVLAQCADIVRTTIGESAITEAWDRA